MMVKMTIDQERWNQRRNNVFVFILVAILVNMSSTLASEEFSMNHYLKGGFTHGVPFYPPFVTDEAGMKL